MQGLKEHKGYADLIGTTVNRWTIISVVPGKGLTRVLCRCSCGTEKIQLASHMRRHTSVSCGCYRIERERFAPGVAARNVVLSSYKAGAIQRNLLWLLTDNEFDDLTRGCCYFCGVPPYQTRQVNKTSGVFTYNGIDRLNSTTGYTRENCVSCCGICNKAKRNLSLADFKEWIARLVKHNS